MATAKKEKTPPELVDLYKGKVQVKFFPDSHQYWVNGKRKSGVTTYIGIMDKSRALMSWKGDRTVNFLLNALEKGEITEELICAASYIDEIEKEEASRLGTAAHDWAEKFINHGLGKGDMPEMPEEKAVQIAAAAFMEWAEEHKVKFVSSERIVYSKKEDFIGKMDIEGKIDGKLYMIDLKTSNGLYNSVRMQTAAYAMADMEESGRKYKGRWAIRLAKYDEAEYIEREEKKRKIKALVAAYKGVEYKPYPIAPYQAFEAMYLDEKAGMIEYDYEAFIHAKKLFEWNKDTDFFTNGRR